MNFITANRDSKSTVIQAAVGARAETQRVQRGGAWAREVWTWARSVGRRGARAACGACCARDRGGAGASGVTWDRGDAGAANTGGARPKRDVRAKGAGGVAVDDGARGTGGVALDGSMGLQRARGGGNGVWTRTGDVAVP